MRLSIFVNHVTLPFHTQHPLFQDILPKGSYLPCVSMAGTTLLAGYHRFQNSHNEFITLNVNVQSIHAKFNQLYPVVSKLSSMGLYFGAICLQETWQASDADVSLLQLPGYKTVHQSSKCTKYGRLIFYLSEMYSFKLRHLRKDSDIWEGLFIDLMGDNLRKPLKIATVKCLILDAPNPQT